MCISEEVLLSRASEILGVEASFMEKHVMDLAMDRKVVIKEEISGEEGADRLCQPILLSGIGYSTQTDRIEY